MKKTIVLMLVALVALTAFVSCENKSSEPTISYSDVLGTWKETFDDGTYIQIKFLEGDDGAKSLSTDESQKLGSPVYVNATVTTEGSVFTFTGTNYASDYRVCTYNASFDANKNLVLEQTGDKTISIYHSGLKKFTLSKQN